MDLATFTAVVETVRGSIKAIEGINVRPGPRAGRLDPALFDLGNLVFLDLSLKFDLKARPAKLSAGALDRLETLSLRAFKTSTLQVLATFK